MTLRGMEVSGIYQVSSLVDNRIDIVQSLIQKGLAHLKIITPESFGEFYKLLKLMPNHGNVHVASDFCPSLPSSRVMYS